METKSIEEDDETLNKIACIEKMLQKAENQSTASDVFLQRMINLVNKEDIDKIMEMQAIS